MLLILFSLLLVVAWFGVGGPVLKWIDTVSLQAVGYTMYALPILLIYLAVETFRAEGNQLPLAVKFAAVLEIVWFSGLFGLLKPRRVQSLVVSSAIQLIWAFYKWLIRQLQP